MERFGSVADVASVERVPLNQRLAGDTILDLLEARSRDAPDNPAICWLPNGRSGDRPEIISYRQLHARVMQTANLLHALGVRSGDPVAILTPNAPEAHYAIWGAACAGIASPINPLLSPQHIAELIVAAGSKVLITAGPDAAFGVWEKVAAVRALGVDLAAIIVIGREAPAGGIAFDLPADAQPCDRLVSGRRIAADDISTLFHTGGTTSAPKLAQQTHGNQAYMAWACAFMLGLTRSDRLLTGLPLFHVNAAIATGISAFAAGASIVLCGPEGYRSKATMADFWNIVTAHRCTMFSGVPTIFASLLDQLPAELNPTPLRIAMSGSAPLPASLLRAFQARTGVRVLEAYGMTEATGAVTSNPRDGERRAGSIGLRLPYQGCRVAIVDDEGAFVRDAGIGEQGRLLLSGPNLFAGYRTQGREAACWPLPDWFDSGDLARQDADGYFWLCGRAKDIIIRSGHNIDPAVIENVLHAHPAVELAAAVGRPDAYAGEMPVAYVSLRAGQKVTPGELQAFAASRVPERPAAPASVYILPQIPVTAVGKIYKPPLRADATARAIEAALAANDIHAAVRTEVDAKAGVRTEIIAPATLHRQIRDALAPFALPFTLQDEHVTRG